MVLLVLFVASASRLRSVPRLLRTTPYVAFSLGYVLAFIIAFSRFANFGLLARQRVQVTPFLLVFLALPKFREPGRRHRGARPRRHRVDRRPAGRAFGGPHRAHGHPPALAAGSGQGARVIGHGVHATDPHPRLNVAHRVYVVDLLTDDAGFRNGVLMGGWSSSP